MQICQAVNETQIQAIRILFEEFASVIRVDLCFQGFQEELAGLPGRYAPPRGRLLLAMIENEPAGCVALKPVSETVCEMKRLFVKPMMQGRSLGRQLAEKAISEAKDIGYSTMLLDTLPSMERAIRLYKALGFRSRTAYYDTPLKETIFMELSL